MENTTSCSKCLYFEDHVVNSGKSKKDDGLCRFNPPVSQPDADAHGLWPVVFANDWCGHFTAQRMRLAA